MTRNAAQNAYDDIPYPSIPKPESHPDHLATLATLYGMTPAPVDRCRMLELACSDGGNITPLAFALPNSEFVGVDLSQRQIEDGRKIIDDLGLKNIRLEHLSISDIDESFGQFDYIIGYGVFSWVNREVQEKIFEVCKKNLSPNGVAYISYNTLPGWHMRGMLRDMMLYHTRESGDLKTSTKKARELLEFLVESLTSIMETRSSTTIDMNAYGIILKRERDLLEKRPDLYLAHDLLEDHNDPVYFNDFIARAAAHGLQFLAESDYAAMQISGFPPAVAEVLRGMEPDIIKIEQYIDFLLNRTFRQTLMCHAGIALNRDLNIEAIKQLYVGSPAKPVSEEVNLQNEAPERFKAASGTVVSVRTPLAKAAMLYLTEIWPAVIPFESLLSYAHRRLDPEWAGVQSAEKRDFEAQSMADMLSKFFALDMVELHSFAPPFVMNPSERPEVSRLARYQAAQGESITNQRHEQVALEDDVTLRLIQLLDGTRDRQSVLAEMMKLVEDGTLVVQPDGRGPVPDDERKRLLVKALDQSMRRISRAALLVG